MDENNKYNDPNQGSSESGTEYHYTKPQSNLYEDADYVKPEDTNEPPRYYVPPEENNKSKKKKIFKKKENKSSSSNDKMWVKVVCLAVGCALIGGIAGGFITRSLSKSKTVSTGSASASTSTVAATETGSMSASEIYSMATSQVVGIQSNIQYSNFFGQTTQASVAGSGFFISEDGYILTNYHVIEDAVSANSTITVLTYDSTAYDATVVGYDSSNDLAVLKIDATGCNAATFADSSKIAVGDTCYAVGNPMGELEFTMTSGMVSALDRSVTTSEYSSAINMFQFDAAINSGNSGGPVYNANGQVIGVATAKYSSSSSSDASVEGLGFAIPANDASKIADDLMTNGHVTGKAYLGVSLDDNYSSTVSSYYNMPEGAYVKYVETSSAAEKAGLQAGDVITKVDDKTISSYTDLQSAVKEYSAGDEATITYYRSGETYTTTITFDEASDETSSTTTNNQQQQSSDGSIFGSLPSIGGSGNQEYSYFG